MTDLKLNKEVLKKMDERYNMAVTPAHLLSYLLDPKTKDTSLELSADKKKQALKYAQKKFPHNSLLPLALKFCAKSTPFQKYIFEDDFVNISTPIEWWRSQETDIKQFNNEVFSEVELILTAKATTANVERIFSSFGLGQSKLRNRLGTEKCAKLVFLLKMLNSHNNPEK